MSFAIIIPVYNCAKYLEETLKSVMNQTRKPDEVLIIDDGSTDSSVSLANKLSFNVISQTNAGPAVARNRAVSIANSEWIIFLDGDDLIEPNRVEEIEKMTLINPHLNFIANNEFEGPAGGPWIKKDLHKKYDPNLNFYRQLLHKCFLSTSSLAIKRDLYLEVGGMDENLRSAQDYDMWLRVAPKANFAFIPQYLSRYILRSESITSNYQSRLECMKTIFNKHAQELGRLALTKRAIVIHLELLVASVNKSAYRQFIKMISSFPATIAKCIIWRKMR